MGRKGEPWHAADPEASDERRQRQTAEYRQRKAARKRAERETEKDSNKQKVT